jgi:hypothetical protein
MSGWIAMTIMGLLRSGTFWRAHPEISFVAIYATVSLAVVAVLTTVGRKLPTPSLRAGFWFVFLFLGGVLALIAPGGIIYFLFPPTAVLIGMAAARRHRSAETIGALVGILLLYLSWSELLGALEELFSPGPLWVVAPVAAILIGAVLIEAHGLVTRANRRGILVGSSVVALAAWIVAGTAPAYSQDHQQRFTIEHVTEFPAGRSSWAILNDGARLPPAYSEWGEWRRGKRDFSQRERWFVRAPAVSGLRPPAVALLQSERFGSERTVRVRLHANGAAQITLVAPEEAHIRSAGVSGFVRPVGSTDTSGKFTITCAGRSCDGAELTMDLLTAKPVRFIVVGARSGLPASAAPLIRARPRFARPQYTPDETLAVTHVAL